MTTKLMESKQKKKKRRMLLVTGLLISILIIVLGGYSVHSLISVTMKKLPAGEYLTEETSPDGTYTVKAYVTIGGATSAFSIRGELVFNKKNGKTKNIYWGYQEDIANIQWLDNDTVVINKRTLDVPGDTYDFRNN